MKSLSVLSLVFLSFNLLAQDIIYWKGGTPGKETNWEEPRNWNTHKIPGSSSHVIISALNSGHNAQPKIQNKIEVASIEIQNGATLSIKPNGELIIDGEFTYSNGISIFGGQLLNNGLIEIKNIGNFDEASFLNALAGNGDLLIDNKNVFEIAEHN